VRWSLLLLFVAIPTVALAEPKVAVAPLDDDDGKVAELVAEVASTRAKVTKPTRVEGAMKGLGVSALGSKSVKKLRAKLDVDVVIYGSVERDGGRKRVSLTLAGSSKAKLEVEGATPKQLRKELTAKLGKRIAMAMEGGGDRDGDEEEAERATQEAERKTREEEERRKQREEEERRAEEEKRRRREEDEARRRDEDERRAERERRKDEQRRPGRDDDGRADRKKQRDDDDDRRADRKKQRDDDDRRADRKEQRDDDDRRADRKERDHDDRRDRKKKRVAEGDEDQRARKRLRDERDDEGDDGDDGDGPREKRRRTPRHVLTHAALWLDGGGAVARRTFTYDATGAMRPPPVGTAAAAGRVEGEVYPAAFSSPRGAAAALGVAGAFSRTFGLGIAVPGTQIVAPIKNGGYAIGARYRFLFGQHSLALGVSYWRRYFMADRSKLMSPDQLDMPDVDYSAIAPGVALRVGATPKVSAFATLDVPLMLHSGPIQDPTSYGASKILAFDVRGGAQVVLTEHAALQIAAELDQVGLSFTGQPGSKAVTRMVSKATERSIGVAATIGIAY
jgi:hypothetical protein